MSHLIALMEPELASVYRPPRCRSLQNVGFGDGSIIARIESIVPRRIEPHLTTLQVIGAERVMDDLGVMIGRPAVDP